MSVPPELAAEWAVDNALDADHDDPFAGDDPPPDWRPALLPGEDERAVGSAFCTDARRADVPFSTEAPF